MLRWTSGSIRAPLVPVPPVVPSPSVRVLRHETGRLQGFLHRRVQSNPAVCCNHRTHCSFLGFCSPSRLSPPSHGTLRLRCRSDGLPWIHPGTGFQVRPVLSLRISPGSSASGPWPGGRLFEGGDNNRRRLWPPWGFSRQRATVTTSRFVASSQGIRLSPLSRCGPSQIGRAHV